MEAVTIPAGRTTVNPSVNVNPDDGTLIPVNTRSISTLTIESNSIPTPQLVPSPIPSIPRTPRDFKSQAIKPVETIPVFNRTHGVMGFMEQDHPYIELPAGRWTTTTTHGKPIPKDFVYRYLLNNPDISVQLPYKPLRGDKTKLTIAAPLLSVTGWGIAASHITNELAKIRLGDYTETDSDEGGIDWNKNEQYWNELAHKSDLVLFPLANWHYQEMPELTQALMRKPHHPTEWALAMTIPSDLPPVPSPNVVLYSMFEVGVLPGEWRELMIKNNVRHLIVPSKSQVDLFRQGYDGEIDVVPLGIDPNVWTPIIRPQRDSEMPFTICLYGLLSARKAPIETIVETCYRAFSGAYGEPVDDWRVIMKTRQGVISGGIINDPHVEIRSFDATPSELHAMCGEADLGIILSRFEGYGLVMREMMASGLPVICSANSGHLDDCSPEYNIPIPTEEIIEAKEMYKNDKENWWWNEPNFQVGAMELRKQYDDWKSRGRTQSSLGIKASEYIHKNRTWRQTARGIQDILDRVIPK